VDGARDSLTKAIALAPNNPKYRADLVDLDFTTKGPDAAVQTARSFAPQQQNLSDLLVANTLVRANRVDEAIVALENAQQSHGNSEILARLAELELQSGKAQVAKKLAKIMA